MTALVTLTWHTCNVSVSVTKDITDIIIAWSCWCHFCSCRLKWRTDGTFSMTLEPCSSPRVEEVLIVVIITSTQFYSLILIPFDIYRLLHPHETWQNSTWEHEKRKTLKSLYLTQYWQSNDSKNTFAVQFLILHLSILSTSFLEHISIIPFSGSPPLTHERDAYSDNHNNISTDFSFDFWTLFQRSKRFAITFYVWFQICWS